MTRRASPPGPAASAPPSGGARAASRGEVLFLGSSAAVTVVGTAVWYGVTIRSQGDSLLTPTPLYVLSSLAAVALLALGGTLVERSSATTALWAATGALLMLGVIGLFSIGLFLLLAGGLALTAAIGSRRRTAAHWALCLMAAAGGVTVALASFAAVAAVD